MTNRTEIANERFDDRRISNMSKLVGMSLSAPTWRAELDIMLAALKQGNLRARPRDFFLVHCHYDEQVEMLRNAVDAAQQKVASDAALSAIAAVLDADNVVSITQASADKKKPASKKACKASKELQQKTA